MRCSLKLACLGVALCTVAALAQTTTSPVAYVYVSSANGTTGTSDVYAFSAAPNGKLTPVPGPPFADQVSSMAVNGKYLFGVGTTGTFIDAYLIESDGSLRYTASTNYTAPNGGQGYGGPIVFDHTGASLYNFDYAALNGNNTYVAFQVVKATGKLIYLNEAGENEELNGSLSFTGNNLYAYGADYYHFSPAIYGFKRNANGSLTQLSINPALPAPPAGSGYMPYLAAADPTNHVAIGVQPYMGYGSPSGPYQLATYTSDSTGNLTTTSTYQNMPAVQVGNVTYLQMAPSGKLLAVAGTGGLQIFHFNGANPITTYTGLLTNDEIDQMFWDNQNHLYAISRTAGRLDVFTITQTTYSQAPGSPHALAGAQDIIVQPWPRY